MPSCYGGVSVAHRWICGLAVFALAALALPVWAVSPQASELRAAGEWADRVFGLADKPAPRAYLKVVQEDVHDGLTRGKSWRGTPFMLGEKVYAHGLAFNSIKQILVHLGRPGERFTADVGLENNDDTRRGAAQGNGSVTFHVFVGGKEVFTSPVRRLKDGAMPLDVALKGAEEFEIRVGDGGDGRGWDQALWGEAVILLVDGSKLRLQDLPLPAGADQNPYGLSFVYNGAASATLLPKWPRQAKEEAIDARRQRREITWTDPATGLEVRAEAVSFRDFPAVEWVVYLKNTGKTDTPIIENIQAMDAVLPLAVSGQATLHWAKGGVASFDDFAPQETVFRPGVKLHLQPGGGRSSSQVMPFFNAEAGGGGVIAAIGWTGEWAADFSADPSAQVILKAGMARTRLLLHPGESIRTPRMLLLNYEGDCWRGQNLLRQFVLAHHRPQRNGQPLLAPITNGNWGGTRAEIHLDNIRKIIENQLPIEYYWIDAEWFGRAAGGWYPNVGNWEVRKELYPNGFKPLSEALRKSGRELMLWFEPERVFKDTPWRKDHPEWMLDTGGDSCLLNLGNSDARKFLSDFISARIDEFGLGCYRQDFNIDPLDFWHKADAPDHQGITEIRYIEGLYAFWDGLLAKHPGLIIDNCASGGRRLDIETLGRATPFWRTDGPRDAIAHQCHTWGLLPWVPLNATSQDRAGDDYEFRSSMSSALCINWWVSGDAPAEKIPDNFPYAWAKRTLDQYVRFRQFYDGDYYPLTGYSQARDLWMAYQLDRPDLGKGLVVALRRPESPYVSARMVLRGLDEKAEYEVTDVDTGVKRARLLSGKELGTTGLEVRIDAVPGSALLMYERKR
ncbi:MAG: alpha-galactosidase [Tepidisphaerales bacterium]